MTKTHQDDIPDDWIPLSEIEATSEDVTGGTFLDPSGTNLSIVQVRKDKPNDLITLYDAEVPDLIRRLVDYMEENDE